MKKAICILLTVLLIIPFSSTVFAESSSDTTLKFDENGEFKICVLADVQEGYPGEEAWAVYMNEMLDDVQPDIVIFLGDNIYTESAKTVDEDGNYPIFKKLVTPMVERGIPFTFVFGNHDDETIPELTKEGQLGQYSLFGGDCCLAYDAEPELHGCATHNLPILSSDGAKVAFNLWMFDSGDYVPDEEGNHKRNGHTFYDCVREDQIEWYKSVSAELESENNGPVPSIVFQHIITEEAMKNVFINSPISLGNNLTYSFTDGTYSTIFPNLSNIDGILLERSCASFDNEGQWDAFVERGDVIAVTSGHDHVNDFVTTIGDIDAIQINACQYHGEYNRDFLRGAKIITINEDNPWNYEAHTAYTFEYALKEGSELPGKSNVTKADYVFAKIMNIFLRALMEVLNAFCKTLKSISIDVSFDIYFKLFLPFIDN